MTADVSPVGVPAGELERFASLVHALAQATHSNSEQIPPWRKAEMLDEVERFASVCEQYGTPIVVDRRRLGDVFARYRDATP
jgi:hypothetical protein